MDEYDKKFAEMQKYIPFLEAMIERLQNVKDKSREVQLQKMQSLHGILSNSKRNRPKPNTRLYALYDISLHYSHR
ncbi:hypothetical protein E2986_11760 [Frieseomelitta varia]|uniref:ARC105/Med15 mediator subunit central domain-containing protein n=1 Tax=Frieseomelitta varia TaxID=561572 RepID=A0A833WDZ6_9HYME|nr:hypothetical protein E2986_11760 [Frieseomelitta varia]